MTGGNPRTSVPAGPRIAIIGSFKQHFAEIVAARDVFEEAGCTITSPVGQRILEAGIDFVRFDTDDTSRGDPAVQSVALHRILGADAVFVVAPEGYVGRTTCYEIGRIIQARRPLYFSAAPTDLPLQVPASHVLDPAGVLAAHRQGGLGCWQPLMPGEEGALERDLLEGRYRTM